MLNYKKWKELNESFDGCLGLVQNNSIGVVHDNPINVADTTEGKKKSDDEPVEVEKDEGEEDSDGDEDDEFSFGSFSTPYFCACKDPKIKEDGGCCKCKRPTLKECIDLARSILSFRMNDESPSFQLATIVSNQGYLSENLVHESFKEINSLPETPQTKTAIKKLNAFFKDRS